MDIKLTYEKARRMCIWVWTLRAKHGSLFMDEIEPLFIKFWGGIPLCKSGFCSFFSSAKNREPNCHLCPLKWGYPKEEKKSNFKDSNGTHSWPCSRNYWHWAYWRYNNKTRARFWAHKMLKEVQATPRTMEVK